MADRAIDGGDDDLEPIDMPEVAAMLNCSVATVWSWVKQGVLPKPFKLGPKTTRLTRGQIREHIRSLRDAAAKAA